MRWWTRSNHLPLDEPLPGLEGEHGDEVAAYQRQRVGVLVQREARLAAQEVLQRERGLGAPTPAPRARIPVQLQVHAVCRHETSTRLLHSFRYAIYNPFSSTNCEGQVDVILFQEPIFNHNYITPSIVYRSLATLFEGNISVVASQAMFNRFLFWKRYIIALIIPYSNIRNGVSVHSRQQPVFIEKHRVC